MNKGLIGVAAAAALSLASVGVLADHRHHSHHDKEWAYLVGGALVGAAIGGLIYSDRYGFYDHGHYRPRVHYHVLPHAHYRPYGGHHVRDYRPHKRHYRRHRHVRYYH
jgi:hypothetical protein